MHTYYAIVLWSGLITSFCSGAQEQKGPAKPKDPQSAFEPRSGPGIGQAFLQKFVGDWEVAKTFYPRSAGNPFRQKGSCRQSMIHGGRFLQSDFVFGEGDKRTTGMGIVGFETTTGRFTSVWTDSRATRLSFRQSKEPFDGKQIVLFSRTLGEVGDKRVSRTVTRLEDNGARIVHQQFAVSESGEQRLVMELVLTKKAAANATERKR